MECVPLLLLLPALSLHIREANSIIKHPQNQRVRLTKQQRSQVARKDICPAVLFAVSEVERDKNT